MAHTVERDWTTKAGLRAAVLYIHGSHRCGYVELPKEHPLFGKSDSDSELYGVQVHGGLTYSGIGDGYPVPSEGYWFGFDCNHSCDMPRYGGHSKSLAFVEQECESLAAQLVNFTPAKAEVEYDELTSLRTRLTEAEALLESAPYFRVGDCLVAAESGGWKIYHRDVLVRGEFGAMRFFPEMADAIAEAKTISAQPTPTP